MRDRLIELLQIGDETRRNPLRWCDDEIVESLADHLLANGVIVPPCKVGDKVWFVERRYSYFFKTFREFVNEGYVKAIKVSMKPMKITIEYPDVDDTKGRCKGADYSATSIGKTVFLTREEAEAKLKEGVQG